MKVRSKTIYCKKCGIAETVNLNRTGNSYVCSKCRNKQWFKKMKKLGCDVVAPERLGDTPFVVQKSIEDYPLIVSDYETYRDITGYFFEDTRYRKEYPTTQEFKKDERKKIEKIIGGLEIDQKILSQKKREERNRKIREMHEKGYYISEIAEKIGYSPSTVSEAIKEMGIRRKRAGSREVTKRSNKILKLHDMGYTCSEIEKKLNCKRHHITYAVRKREQGVNE